MIAITRHDGVTRLHCSTWRSRVSRYDVSAYLVDGVLVDTAFARVTRALMPLLDELRPRGVFVTHGHEDHAGNAEHIARRGIPMWITPATAAVLRSTRTMRGYRSFTWGHALPLATPPVPFDPAPFLVIDTPGHSDDHQVLWDPARRRLFAGDLFLGVKVRLARTGERPRAHVASLRRVAALEPVQMFDAHRGPLGDAASLLRAKADWMEETIAEIARRFTLGEPAGVIRHEVLGDEPQERWVSFGDYSKARFVEAVRAESLSFRGGEATEESSLPG
jgi:glyoxylase-like metal-dependent hydrolase (beta-lactamase superfamily II)